jgi:anti-sigma B factor antagonist
MGPQGRPLRRLRQRLRRLTEGWAPISSKEQLCIVSAGQRNVGAGRSPEQSRRPLFRIIQFMSNPTHLEVNESASITVARFKDKKIIDPETIQEIGQELFDLVDKDERRKLVLNFINVEFLSSAALGKLITFKKKVSRNDAKLILTNISPEIYQVFTITKLDREFTIKDTEADALAVL